MTDTGRFSPQDEARLTDLGISRGEVERQAALIETPPPPSRLQRACRPGDGIVQLSEERQSACIDSWRLLPEQYRLVKFVPASGAATRMFKDLTADPSSAGEPDAATQRLLDHLTDFAFYDSLRTSCADQSFSLDAAVEASDGKAVVQSLLGPNGLGYATAPKGLILFHRYPEGARTALEEQIREGFAYLASSEEPCRYHFTVTESHQQDFEEQVNLKRRSLEAELKTSIEVDFSTQSPATDTIALGLSDRLVRTTDGNLLLRPAGHGALLSNLQGLDADIVWIKNIDNVAHQRFHPLSIHWKRVLAGYFIQVQNRIFRLQEDLESRSDSEEWWDRGIKVLETDLAVEIPAELHSANRETRRRFLIGRLDRPLRICGMVRNEGEPGGGPFWLPDRAGGQSGQIVEAAQVDTRTPDQRTIWEASSHFNPVDLVCGLRDRKGNPYSLDEYVDPTTSFVAEKTYDGRPIRALERPGLWNGAMAGWNTAFIEVPLGTFTPVKTVFDLLRPEHQP